MNDIRRTILWVIFGFSMVLLWDQWQVFNGQKPTFFPPATTAAKPPAVANTPASSVPPGVAAVPGTTAPVAAAVPSAIPATPSADAPAAAVKKERIVISNDVLTLSFDTEGGALVGSVFTKYADMNDKSKGFVLLDESNSRVYVAQTGLIGTSGAQSLPTHKTLMTALPGERKLQPGQNQVEIKFESPAVGGVKLVKTYTLKRGAYDLNVRHDIVNTGSEAVAPQLYLQLVRDGNKPEGESSFYMTFTGPVVYTEAKKYQKVEFSEAKKKNATFEKTSPNGYIAMVQHYFVSAWILPDGVQRKIDVDAVDIGIPVSDCCYRVNMVAPLEAIAPGASKSIEAKLFIGPQEEKVLEALAPGLELVKDYVWLTILAKPLYWLLDKLYSFIHNWGWAIMALVLLLKIAFYWLNAKA